MNLTIILRRHFQSVKARNSKRWITLNRICFSKSLKVIWSGQFQIIVNYVIFFYIASIHYKTLLIFYTIYLSRLSDNLLCTLILIDYFITGRNMRITFVINFDSTHRNIRSYNRVFGRLNLCHLMDKKRMLHL